MSSFVAADAGTAGVLVQPAAIISSSASDIRGCLIYSINFSWSIGVAMAADFTLADKAGQADGRLTA